MDRIWELMDEKVAAGHVPGYVGAVRIAGERGCLFDLVIEFDVVPVVAAAAQPHAEHVVRIEEVEAVRNHAELDLRWLGVHRSGKRLVLLVGDVDLNAQILCDRGGDRLGHLLANRRLIAQSGTFAIPGILNRSMDEILSTYPDPMNTLVKFILPSEKIRDRGLRELYRMNITHATLFPDLDGLARSLAYELEFHWAYDPHTSPG